MTLEREERTCFLEREPRLVPCAELAPEELSPMPQELQRFLRISRLDLREGEQVVGHRDVRVVLRSLEDLERPARVPARQLRLVPHRVEA